MTKKFLIQILFIFIFLIVTACSAIDRYLPIIPSPTPQAEISATGTIQPSATIDVKATEAVQLTSDASSQATQAQIAFDQKNTATQEAATQQVGPFYSTVQKLYNDKVISSTEGRYYALADFSQSWAQIDWYKWWNTNLSPYNFVLQSDIAYETASMTSNWESAGCGFIFRDGDDSVKTGFHHYRALFGLDGIIYVDGVNGYEYYDNQQYGKYIMVGKKYYQKPQLPSGKFKMLIAVDKNWITVYINNEQILHLQDNTFSSGNLSFTLASGTNKDFGTTCKFTNTEVWSLE